MEEPLHKLEGPQQTDPEPPPADIPYWLRAIPGIPLTILGGFVTMITGVILCAYCASRVAGARPESVAFGVLCPWLFLGAAPLAAGLLLLRAFRPTRRFWGWTCLAVCALFVAVGADSNFGPTNWHHVFRRDRYPGTDATTLQRTVISSHLEENIAKGSNLLWCGTFQLAWDEACRLTGGDLRFSREHPMISALNRHIFNKDSLDEDSYVAMAGFTKDDIHKALRKNVEQKFHGRLKPRFLPDERLTPRPQDFVAYACLYKKFTFPAPFERLDESLTFEGVSVPAFGFGTYKSTLEKVYPQVLILDYQNEDDFVIELKTESSGDRLILAKMQPQPTLDRTITNISERIVRCQAQTAATNDILLVPRLKFDLTRRYSEIEGLRLIPRATNVAPDLILRSAVQNTAFEMNERGVELKSEAHMSFACAKQERPIPQRRMIFDKPFLILMQRTNARMPYFALWVDNPEILVTSR